MDIAQKAGFHGQPEKTTKNEILRRHLHAQTPSLPRKRESRPPLDSRFRGNDAPLLKHGSFHRAPWESPSNAGLSGSGRGLFEGVARVPQPRSNRVAQGTGRSPATTQGRLLLRLLSSWRSKKKVCPRLKRGKQGFRRGTCTSRPEPKPINRTAACKAKPTPFHGQPENRPKPKSVVPTDPDKTGSQPRRP